MMKNSTTPSTAADMQALLAKYDRPAPRYTSYPPAPYFIPYGSPAKYLELLENSNKLGPKNISLYFHLPFCPQRCLFCGCHTEIGNSGTMIRDYMRALRKETANLLPLLDAHRPVTQIHLGGGTPNAVPYSELRTLLDTVRNALPLDPDCEIAIECDPSLLTLDKVQALRDMGFTRISMGIQDFNRKVLDAVHRRVPKLSAAELVAHARAAGFRGLNLDLIYGLPHQTLESFQDTLRMTLEADPDRVSVFAYAHVPWVKGHQGSLDSLPMPDPSERLSIAILTRKFFTDAGYVPIGMDHFVKPDDELALALAEGHLHRNFQGYCSKRHTGQVYAFGASAISQMEWGYGQNLKDLAEYTKAVDRGELPLERVYYMTPEDILAREAINALMCYGRVDLEAVAARAGTATEASAKYVRDCEARILPILEEGWVHRDGHAYSLSKDGWLFVRQFAATLDPRTSADAAESPARFSKAI